MLKNILRKELLENIHSYRFPLFALICVVLIPLGMSVNNAQYAKRLKDYNEQARLADEAQTGLKIQDLMAGRVTIKGFRPPSQLSIFSQGLENALPRYYQFGQDGYSQGESSSGDETLASTQGKFDFVFLIQMVISFVGLLFALCQPIAGGAVDDDGDDVLERLAVLALPVGIEQRQQQQRGDRRA